MKKLIALALLIAAGATLAAVPPIHVKPTDKPTPMPRGGGFQ